MSSALADAAKSSTHEPREVGTDDGEDIRRLPVLSQHGVFRSISVGSQPIESPPPQEGNDVRAKENSTEPREDSCSKGGGGMSMSLPIGEPISVSTFGYASASRKKNIDVDSSWHCLNPGSCASGINLLHGGNLMTPGSSAFDLVSLNSSISISRMLGLSSLTSLKKLKNGDISTADLERTYTSPESHHRNSDWATRIPTSVPPRPHGNMFLNCLLSTRLSPAEDHTTTSTDMQRQVNCLLSRRNRSTEGSTTSSFKYETKRDGK